MKKTEIENEVFTVTHHLGMNELNTQCFSKNGMIKHIMDYMCEEFKSFLDKEYDLDERYFTEDLFMVNKIRFVPTSIFYGDFDKKKRKSVTKTIRTNQERSILNHDQRDNQ